MRMHSQNPMRRGIHPLPINRRDVLLLKIWVCLSNRDEILPQLSSPVPSEMSGFRKFYLSLHEVLLWSAFTNQLSINILDLSVSLIIIFCTSE